MKRDLVFVGIFIGLLSMVLVSLYMLYVIGNADATMAMGGIRI